MEGLLSLIRNLIPKSVFRALQPTYHWLLAASGTIVYRFPARRMVVVAVTGTNGKTTTSLLINELLKAGGLTTGLASTTTLEVAGKPEPNLSGRTNLGRWQFVRLTDRMRRAGCTHLVVEAASEGIAQHRLLGVPIDVAVLTNLSPDHLNTHGTMEEYRRVKERIFAALTRTRRLPGAPKVSVVNADDPVAEHFLAHPADRKMTFGVEREADFRAKEIRLEGSRSRFRLSAEGEEREIELFLAGRFNVENALAATAAARALGVSWSVIESRLAGPVTTPGRLEDVETGRGFRVVVDYAHSEDALRKLYQALREQIPDQVGDDKAGRLIAVLGAAGDRDREKRPHLGRAAAELADVVIVTDEEPYHEDPATIIEAVAAGVRAAGKTEGEDFEVVADRRLAIRGALKRAKAGDIVVVTGMGHQRYKTVGDRKIPWQDQAVIKEELERL
jgi:UDP-N-acetylmuramoyl-L-alanyl-D-glutamate--2,6-diaminopimelate ligase